MLLSIDFSANEKFLLLENHLPIVSGPFNKYVSVEGEGGAHEIRDKPLQKFREEEGQDLPVT